MDEILSENNTSTTTTRIQTFIFFDIETTGLIQGSKIPKITEISLVAISRDSLLSKDAILPRVMHKLSIPLQPLSFIPLEVSQITGLYNDLLEQEKPFDQQFYELLNAFITRLHSPVCLVAHNGNQFDYPILLTELNRVGKSLSEDILCVDSLVAFKTYFGTNSVNAAKKTVASRTTDDFSEILNDGWDAPLAAVLDDMDSSTYLKDECFDVTERTEMKCEMDTKMLQKLNETTPSRHTNNSMNLNQCKVPKRMNKVSARKRLPFTCDRPNNFRLETLHQHIVGSTPLNSHSAEADCLSLLQCVLKIGNSFVSWADLNAVPLVRYAARIK